MQPGANIAEDVTYSGTIAGAIEGTLAGGALHCPFSQTFGFNKDEKIYWETAIAHGPGLIKRLLDTGFPADVLLNINFPDLEPEDVKGTAVTRQGRRDPGMLHIDKRTDPWGTPYSWFDSSAVNQIRPKARIYGDLQRPHFGNAAASRSFAW